MEYLTCPVCETQNIYQYDYCTHCDFVLAYLKSEFIKHITEDEVFEYEQYLQNSKKEYEVENLKIEETIPSNYEDKISTESEVAYINRHLSYGYIAIEDFETNFDMYDSITQQLTIETKLNNKTHYINISPIEAIDLIKDNKDNKIYQIIAGYENNDFIKNYKIIFNNEIYNLEESITITHNSLEYKTVRSPHTNKIWLDRNLGASRVAHAIDDEEAYGDYFQWGRMADGHEKKDSNLIHTLSKTNTPDHGDFIISNSNNKFDWREEKNNKLWQGINSINNPCPEGFRIPTKEELVAETINVNVKNATDAYNSFLKIPSAGYRYHYDGSLRNQAKWCCMWTSSIEDDDASLLCFDSNIPHSHSYGRSGGVSIRCIKDD